MKSLSGMQLLQLLLLVKTISTLAFDWRITFPKDSDACTLANGAPGICRNIRFCPEAQIPKAKVVNCPFEGSEWFVCCTEQSSDRVGKRATTERVSTESPVTETAATERAATNRVRISNGRVLDRVATKVCEDTYPLNFAVPKDFDTNFKEFPYMIALNYETEQQNVFAYKCSGVLISRDFMLTAAHCAKMDDLEPVMALRGGEHLNDRSAIIHRIAEVIVHPDYNSTFAYNDIALIRLEKPININYNSDEFACVWDSYELPDKKVTAINYGQHEFMDNASNVVMLKDDLTIISNKQCNHYFESYRIFLNGIADTQICAETLPGSDTCQSNSGGPLVMRAAINGSNGIVNTLFTRPYIVGITSFSQGCTGQPGVYTRVSAYIDWIENIVWPRKPEKIKQVPY